MTAHFKPIRRVGVGDREKVRSGLLQVLCLDPTDVGYQVEQALVAAKKLKRTLRIYFNADLVPSPEVHRIVHVIMGRARDHDVMVERGATEKRFEWIMNRCDVFILPSESPEQLLSTSIIDLCAGCRDLNAFGLTVHQAKQKLPHLYGNEDAYWKIFKGSELCA